MNGLDKVHLMMKIELQLKYKIEIVNNHGFMIDSYRFRDESGVKQWLKDHNRYEIVYREDNLIAVNYRES
jgi:hypothetical protein